VCAHAHVSVHASEAIAQAQRGQALMAHYDAR